MSECHVGLTIRKLFSSPAARDATRRPPVALCLEFSCPSVRPFVRPLAGRAVVDVSCVDFETWVLGLINFAFCKQIAFSYSGKHGPVPTRTITEPFTNPSKVGPETPES